MVSIILKHSLTFMLNCFGFFSGYLTSVKIGFLQNISALKASR